ncbi:DUF4249 domain-containing protein [Haliscomenobacter hydrossis]|uniref:Lipoprotein n=1 Tax=Haliscomenobacter hydrossis (strain ATCC 27775 / DSM 1100 / LMG 10767 / O) TaxID=760192 RepID=F4L392_HALH1|nr:DUF4249 domain-containing protein [Haliscomenobacter hydrossis]AEE51726.1 hypothetical protein Halhy_3875 [Haliscomenobacter hydrossis DSM 1100]
MKYNIIPYVILFFFCSCDKDIAYKFDSFQPKMVVNANLSPQDGILVQVSRSIPPNEDVSKNKIWINDAVVKLYEDGTLLRTLPFKKDGLYGAVATEFNPSIGHLYSLQIEHPEFGEMSSEAISIPPPPIILSSKVERSPNLSINNDPQVRWQVHLKDPLENNGGYLSVITIKSSQNAYSESPYNSTLLNTKIGQFCELFFTYGNRLLFKNECFKGQEVELTFEFDVSATIGPIGQRYTPDQLELKLYSIDETLYEYYRTQNRPEDFELAFSDPEPLYSNMEGGYGVFLAFNYLSYSFPIPK